MSLRGLLRSQLTIKQLSFLSSVTYTTASRTASAGSLTVLHSLLATLQQTPPACMALARAQHSMRATAPRCSPIAPFSLHGCSSSGRSVVGCSSRLTAARSCGPRLARCMHSAVASPEHAAAAAMTAAYNLPAVPPTAPGGGDGSSRGSSSDGRSTAGDVAVRRKVGHLHVIIGPMFAGKTTRLLRHVTEHRDIGHAVLVVKSSTDTRSRNGHVQTHDGATAKCCAAPSLQDVRKDELYAACQVVAIDEAQFFPDLLEGVVAMVDEDHKVVYVAGLDGDFQRRPFGEVLLLVPHAEAVTKLTATCQVCREATDQPVIQASFTQRTVNSSEQVLVGGADAYRPVCRHHFLSHRPAVARADAAATAAEEQAAKAC